MMMMMTYYSKTTTTTTTTKSKSKIKIKNRFGQMMFVLLKLLSILCCLMNNNNNILIKVGFFVLAEEGGGGGEPQQQQEQPSSPPTIIDNNDNNNEQHQQQHQQQKGFSSLIQKGKHPKISYVGSIQQTHQQQQDEEQEESTTTEGGDNNNNNNNNNSNNKQLLPPLKDLRIKYKYNKQLGQIYEYDDTPRYFLLLQDDDVETELEYRRLHNKWSDRVILEKLYFCSLFGTSGLPRLSEAPKDGVQKLESVDGWDILERDSDYCTWTGLECNDDGDIVGIRLGNYNLIGTLPTELGLLSKLTHFDLRGNTMKGKFPISVWEKASNMKMICLASNKFEGTLPSSIRQLSKLEQIWLSNNNFSGSLPEGIFDKMKALRLIDFSNNNFEGNLPVITNHPMLVNVFLEHNSFTGTLVDNPQGLNALQVIDVGNNMVSGTISVGWMQNLPKLRDYNVAGNRMTGTIPTELLYLSNLEILVLSGNGFSGTIPTGARKEDNNNNDDEGGGRTSGRKWADLQKLSLLMLNHNLLSGTLPPELFFGLSDSLTILDIGNNTLWGPIPKEIGKASKLQRIDAQGNSFTGSLPVEMNRMDPNLELNLTDNFLVGSVPKLFCGGGAMSISLLYRQFGCDAILCPSGTFHPDGAATLESGCRPCPPSKDDSDEGNDPSMAKVLGRTKCRGTTFVHGDLNGDGVLSPREILRLLYVYTTGRNWGPQFQTWADPLINECDLNGITCVNGAVAKIDLTDAALCSNGERKMGPVEECRGLPAELSQLTNLEVLSLNRRQFLRGTLPTEFGRLTRLKYLDISSCPVLTGTIPSEIGALTNLKFLNLGGCRFNGTLPEQLFSLTNLEKFHLSMTGISGTVPTKIGQLRKLKELMFSRTQVSGVLPNELGDLVSIENLEMYGNRFHGTIPASLGNCTNLKRIDLFNNKLTGTIPSSLTSLQSLQILHVKLNRLTGTISPLFGSLPFLSWFDVSSNRIYGTIPATFGASRSMKDFRVGGNMIYAPIPQSLCSNTNINGGLTRMYGCDGVICPLGTYSDPGHATHSEGCKPCPEGETTMYLGSSSCEEFSETDILSMFFDVMGVGNVVNVNEDQETESNVCEWEGITCDEGDAISSIRFPLGKFNDADFFRS